MSKTAKELGQILAGMYENAPRKELVVMVHLFGVQYHDEIKAIGIKDIVEASGIPSNYTAEINKGVNLAKYVDPKPALR